MPKGQIPWNKGKTGVYSEEFMKKMNKYKLGVPLTKKHRKKLSENHWSKKEGYINPCKGRKNYKIRGKNNPNWKGGITSKNRLERESLEAEEWRKRIFERDNYTCQGCGDRGTHLHAHHLISFANHPEYRYEEWNGQTACKACHDNLHKELGYGR